MLRLLVIVHNPVGASAITWVGTIILAALTAVIVALWVVLARRTVQPEEGAADPALEALRRRRLVVRPSRKSRDPEAPVVSELDPAGKSEPTGG
jgi:hypothetical protein